MSRVQKLRVLALLCMAAGVAFAAAWAIATVVLGDQLTRNGVWLMAVLLVLIGVAFATAAWVAEVRRAGR